MTVDETLLSLSVVSHQQMEFVDRMLGSLKACWNTDKMEIILTENISSEKSIKKNHQDLSIQLVINDRPRGFAANHNQAFRRATGEYFCIANPDILFVEDVFPQLISDIRNGLGDVVAPLVVNSDGQIQDSFRSLPSPMELLKRRTQRGLDPITSIQNKIIYPDWIAGIFLFMRSEAYQTLGGLDERYKLYFEDVDFGCRARLAGYQLLVDTQCRIIHDAQRMSRQDPRFLFQHLKSAFRFYTSNTYRLARGTLKSSS